MPKFHEWGLLYSGNQYDIMAAGNAEALVTNLLADPNQKHWFAVHNNTVENMRSLVNFFMGTGLTESFDSLTTFRVGPMVIVEDNVCTNVAFALHYPAASSMTVQMWAAYNDPEQTGGYPWFRVKNNGQGTAQKHIGWNCLAGHPELDCLQHYRLCNLGIIQRQSLGSFAKGQ
jgi:hypothetical protein